MPFLKRCMKTAHPAKVTALSTLVQHQLMRTFGLPLSDIPIIPNGVDLQEFNPRNKAVYRRDARDALGVQHSERLLLFVGKEFRRKGLDEIIRALPLINARGGNCRLLVIGENYESYPPTSFYKSLAASLGVGDKVIFLGHSSNVNCYMAADLFVFPAKYEPFGMVVAEAMATGVGVLVSKSAGISEFIGDTCGDCFIDDPSDPEEISARVLAALASGPDLQARVLKGAQQFSWDRVAEQFLALYESILAIRGGGPSSGSRAINFSRVPSRRPESASRLRPRSTH